MRVRWLLFVLVLLFAGQDSFGRTWTKKGGEQIQATFRRVQDGSAVVLRGTKVLLIPLADLSDADIDYIRATLQKTGQISRLPPELRVPADAAKPAGQGAAADADANGPPTAGQQDGADTFPERTWTDILGHTMTARLVRREGNVVTLRSRGIDYNFPFDGFCAADRAYLRSVTGDVEMPPAADSNMAPQPPPRMWPPPSPPGPNVGVSPFAPANQNPKFEAPRFDRPPPRSPAPSPSPAWPPAQAGPQFSPPSPPRLPDLAPRNVPVFTDVKVCMKCNKPVPDDAKAGDRCPHCGVLWAVEKDQAGRIVGSSAAYGIGELAGSVFLIFLVLAVIARIAKRG